MNRHIPTWRTCCVHCAPVLIALLGGAPFAAGAADDPGALPDVVVATAPLQGPMVDADKLPGLVQTLSTADVARSGTAGLGHALGLRLASVSIGDATGSAYQPDVLYRGFTASPVLGTPQGLAVYQNGVRINEAFGDAVNWDLVPDVAIDRVDVLSSNPVYGLNALGGGITIQMKDGLRFHGAEADASGGSFGERAGSVQVGAGDDRLAVYAAVRVLDRDGWRRDSGERIRQLYAVASRRTADWRVDLAYTRGSNLLHGQGAAPVQELAVDRSLVFTGPQGDGNRVNFLTLNGTWRASDSLSIEAVAYGRWYAQDVDNGNRTDAIRCAPDVAPGMLCQNDGVTLLRGTDGAGLADPTGGSSIPLGENDRERIRSSGRGASVQAVTTRAVAGHPNVLTVGVSVDHAQIAFGSSAEIGPIDGNLVVVPTGLLIRTSEGSDFTATPVRLNARQTYVGGYATDTMDLAPTLAVTASGRYNVARLDLLDLAGSALTGSSRYAHFNPALGFAWKWRPTITAYAGLSHNARTPTASEIECSDPTRPCLLPSTLAGDPPLLRQVIARTTEAGLRGRVGAAGTDPWRLAWHVGAFRTDLDDDIYGVAAGTGSGTGYFRNIGSTRRQGLEAGIDAQRGAWSGFLNIARVDATFETTVLLPSPWNPAADLDGDILVRPGNRLPGIARQRLKADLTRTLGARGRLGVTVTAMGPAFLHGDEVNRMPPVPGYAVLGVHADYDIGDRVALYARVSNALDARFSTFGVFADAAGVGAPGVPVDGANPRFETPAAPRSIVAGIRIRL